MPPLGRRASEECGSPTFEAEGTTFDVVCSGDTITGWNNFGVVRDWPSRTYPEFFQPA